MTGSRHDHLSDAPALIVGAPRSGTTWLQRMLLADPRCCGGQESHFFVSFGRVLRDFDHKAGLERPHGLAGYWRRDELVDELRRLWRRTVRGVVDAAPDALLLVEKTPDHARWLDVVDEIVPAARIVHVVRDSRAVCASLLAARRQSWGGVWAPRTAAEAARIWTDHVEAAEQFGVRAGPTRFLRVRYEDLHADASRELARAWSFLGLDADEDRLAEIVASQRFDAQAGSGGTPFVTTGDLAGVTPPEPDGFFRDGTTDGWRRELGPLQRWIIGSRTATLMRDLGYER